MQDDCSKNILKVKKYSAYKFKQMALKTPSIENIINEIFKKIILWSLQYYGKHKLHTYI